MAAARLFCCLTKEGNDANSNKKGVLGFAFYYTQMKTTKNRLLKIVLAGSIAVNVIALLALGYIASVDFRVHQMRTTLKTPVLVHVGKSAGENSSPAAAAVQK